MFYSLAVKIGAVMLFGGHVKDDGDVDFLISNGFDFGELVLPKPDSLCKFLEFQPTGRFPNDFFLIAHGPREGNPSDLESLWNKYFPALRNVIQGIHEIGIKLLTIHLWMDPRFVARDILKDKIEFLKQITAFAQERAVTICMENLSESVAEFETILAQVPGLRMTLDVGHANLLTESNRSVDFIRRFPDQIRHIHFHDNKGGDSVKDDIHVALGAGSIDFASIVSALVKAKYAGTITFELEPEVLAQSRKFVERLIAAARAT